MCALQSMPRGKGRGGRRGPRRYGFGAREIEYKEEGEEYAQVKKMLGNMRLSVYCFDAKTRIAKVRGSLRRARIRLDDIVLVALREFEEEKCDVIHVYRPEEVKVLKASGEIPADVEVSEAGRQDLVINFGAEEDEKEKEKPRQKSNVDEFMPASESEEESEDSVEEDQPEERVARPQARRGKGGGSDGERDELDDI